MPVIARIGDELGGEVAWRVEHLGASGRSLVP